MSDTSKTETIRKNKRRKNRGSKAERAAKGTTVSPKVLFQKADKN